MAAQLRRPRSRSHRCRCLRLVGQQLGLEDGTDSVVAHADRAVVLEHERVAAGQVEVSRLDDQDVQVEVDRDEHVQLSATSACNDGDLWVSANLRWHDRANGGWVEWNLKAVLTNHIVE
jgi:hypothetical protein